MEGEQHSVRNPATGEELALVRFSTSSDVEQVVEVAAEAFND
ncbi:hypothetical protein ACFFQF_20175 [Haladaptatus pallidirubidus]|nr:hypothetical protein [Haladaptatus pallidirubidus]